MFLQDQLAYKKDFYKSTNHIENYDQDKKTKGILSTEENKAFLSIVAHNIKNPFGALLGYSDLMLEDFSDLSESEKLLYLSEIKNTADYTYKYLERFFEWIYYKSDKYEINFDKYNLQSIISRAFEKVYKKTDFLGEVEFKISKDLQIYSDFESSVKLFFYIIENAITYCKRNGKINICAINEDEFVRIEITNEGKGFTEDKIKQVFDISKDISSSENGTGLGLILAEQLVKINYGSIKIKNKLNVGATVIIKIPKS